MAATQSGRLAHVSVHSDHAIQYSEGGAFDAVALGERSTPVEYNSVVLIKGLLSPEECAALVADVESQDTLVADATADSGHQRFELRALAAESQQLFEKILRDRLLPFVATELPEVEEMVWARSQLAPTGAALRDCALKYSAQEPAINRYAAGGHFEPHRDTLALTLNVLLSTGFEGGGTEFWPEDAGEDDDPSCCCLHPVAGTGVVFNGNVKHAGRAVTQGLRHVLVASFSVVKSGGGLAGWSGGDRSAAVG